MKLNIRIAIKNEKKIEVTEKIQDIHKELEKESIDFFNTEENQELEEVEDADEKELDYVAAKKKTVADLRFKPTESMAAEAKRALKWKEDGHAGGTLVGLARANQLAKRENLSATTVKRMHSFFSRHEVDKKGKGFSGGDGYPSKGRVAWALWGGDAGQSWARMMAKRIDKAKGKK